MVKLQPSAATQYEVIEPGVYGATIDVVTPKDPNPRFEDSRPQLEFIFLVTDEGFEDAKVFGWTGQTFGPKSKLRPWLAVLMPTFDPDKDQLDTDDLIGKMCRIVVTLKKGEDGIERNRVGEVLPLETRRRGSAAPAKEAEPVPF